MIRKQPETLSNEENPCKKKKLNSMEGNDYELSDCDSEAEETESDLVNKSPEQTVVDQDQDQKDEDEEDEDEEDEEGDFEFEKDTYDGETLLEELSNISNLLRSEDKAEQNRGIYELECISSTDDYTTHIIETGMLPELVELLSFDSNDKVLGCVVNILQNLSHKNDHKPEIVKAGAVKPLVRLLDCTEKYFLESVLDVLQNLAVNNEKNKAFIVNEGVLPPLLNLLGSENENIQEHCIGTLQSLSYNNQNNTKIIDLNAVPLLVNLLSTTSNEEIQVKVCSILQNLAHGRQDDNRSLISASGALEPLINLLSSNNPKVQEGVLSVLGNLSINNETKITIAKNGALPLLTKLLTSPQQKIQQYTALAFRNLACNDENKVTIVKVGALPHLVDLLKSNNEKVQEGAVNAIRNLSHRNEDNKVHIVKQGALPFLVSLLSSPNEKVQEGVVNALQNMSHNNDKNKVLIVNQQALPPLINLLDSANEEVQEGAVGTLQNLACGNDVNKRSIVEQGAVQRTIKLLKSQNKRVQKCALSLLSNLSHNNEENRGKIVSQEVLIPLIPLLSPSSDKGVQQSAVGTLWSLSYSKEKIKEIADYGALKPLISLLNGTNKKIQEGAIGCLRNLSHNTDNKISIVKLGGLPKLIELLSSNNEKVREGTIGTLWNLSSTPKNDPRFVKQVPIRLLLELLTCDNTKIQTGVVNIINNIVSGKEFSQPLLIMIVVEGAIPVLKNILVRTNTQEKPLKPEEEKLQQKVAQLLEKFEQKIELFEMLMNSSNESLQFNSAVSLVLLTTENNFLKLFRGQNSNLSIIMSTFANILERNGDGVESTHVGFAFAHLIEVASHFSSETKKDTKPEPQEPNIITPQTCSQFAGLFNQTKFSDIEFEIEERTIPAHRIILSLSSQYFELMFTDGMKESTDKTIKIPDKTYDTFFKVLLSCYDMSQVEITNLEEGIDLLLAADQYLLKNLKEFCETYIAFSSQEDNVIQLMDFATNYHFQEIENSCIKWIINNWVTVVTDVEGGRALVTSSDFIEKLKTYVVERIDLPWVNTNESYDEMEDEDS